ncbi:hypothetical protein [Thalassospira sp. A3_1]|uniref:hypothetical protein n=1 Tax=Thalassospira sp. A3_1 TaxID=2821088 RepID=UPI001ADB66EF|nr:hypothetical protein [Thalassospira sp. A3_1]MBO9509389.1 hypothetical protein [Thalassospira sp. A3_1]
MNSIGIRLYKITLQTGARREEADLSNAGIDTYSLINRFLVQRANAMDINDRQRTWHVERREADGRFIRGVFKYGHYGYQADLIDGATSENRYRRQSTDVEVIPLYYSFWIPNRGNIGIAAFQSFQGKSCIDIVASDLMHYFSNLHHESKLLIRKTMPSSGDAALLNQQVKRLVWTKKNQSADTADELRNLPITEFDVEMTFKAKRRGRFGSLRDVLRELQDVTERSTFVYQGVEFEQGCAEVLIGNKLQKVGVFGFHSNAGVIDITDQVQIVDGHPLFESIVPVVDGLTADMFTELTT